MASRTYRVTVDGVLSDRAAGVFEGMNVTREGGTTVLHGRVRDQADFHGLLHRVSDLGLTLLSATPVEQHELASELRSGRLERPDREGEAPRRTA